jgi:hypothetical protein
VFICVQLEKFWTFGGEENVNVSDYLLPLTDSAFLSLGFEVEN